MKPPDFFGGGGGASSAASAMVIPSAVTCRSQESSKFYAINFPDIFL
jgi:hypothetical protein